MGVEIILNETKLHRIRVVHLGYGLHKVGVVDGRAPVAHFDIAQAGMGLKDQ